MSGSAPLAAWSRIGIGQLVADIEPERELRERRDDDDFDHDGVDDRHDGDDDDDDKPYMDDDDDDNDCIPDMMDYDKDNDGIDDDDDTGDRETMKKDSGSFAPGRRSATTWRLALTAARSSR